MVESGSLLGVTGGNFCRGFESLSLRDYFVSVGDILTQIVDIAGVVSDSGNQGYLWHITKCQSVRG